MKNFNFLTKICVPNGAIGDNPTLVSDDGLAPNRRQAIIWTNTDPIHWCIYAALGWDALTEDLGSQGIIRRDINTI